MAVENMAHSVTWDSLVNRQTALVFGSVLLLTAVYHRRKQYKNLPPGPWALPIVGSMLALGKDFVKGMMDAHKKYGNIFTAYLGSEPTIILNSYNTVKEAFVTHGNIFAGRPQNTLIVEEITKGFGIFNAEGEIWREQKKFAHKVLREFGVGRNILEIKIQGQARAFCEHISANCSNRPHNIRFELSTVVNNVINSILFNRSFDFDDTKFHAFMRAVNEDLFSEISSDSLLVVFPFLRHVPGNLFRYQTLKKIIKMVNGFLESQIDEHFESYTPNERRDIVDAFIAEMEKDKAAGKVDTNFHKRQLLGLSLELFLAGTESVATVLRWGLLMMALNPDMQRRVQAEIDEVIGPNQMPALQDRGQMPYTEATILEILRYADISPLSPPHKTLEDIELCGHKIPKGISVMANLHSAHRDPKIWKEPFKFNPKHFLDAEGCVQRKENLIPFSMGKRVCLGESLVRMELFLFFTSLMQRFTVTLPADRPLPSTEGQIIGGLRAPMAYEAIFIPRE